MYQSNEINELVLALSKAQGEIMGAVKDSTNPFFKSKYADLNSVWTACREPLSKNGLAVIQTVNQFDGDAHLVTTLAHSSGQWIKSTLPLKMGAEKEKTNQLQALGSCITYLRRYALSAIVGVCPDEDEDGNEGGKVYKNQNQKKPDVTPMISKIDKKEGDDLKQILQSCSPDYQSKVDAFLMRQKISSIYELPLETYARIKTAAIENSNKYFYEMKQELNENLENAEAVK